MSQNSVRESFLSEIRRIIDSEGLIRQSRAEARSSRKIAVLMINVRFSVIGQLECENLFSQALEQAKESDLVVAGR